MARYLISMAYTKKGTPKKQQPADRFRRLLVKQKIKFTETALDPLHDRLGQYLLGPCWDAPRKNRKTGAPLPTLRSTTPIAQQPATLFEWDELGNMTTGGKINGS